MLTMTNETIAERIASIKELVMRMHEKELKFSHQIHDEDMDWYKDAMFLIEQAERAQKLEAELKGTITKKNRQHKETLKRLKKAEWEAMIHKANHGRIYTEHFQLQESLKRGGEDD